jgi:G3E family GTPase
MNKIKATILTGFLGSGKTTLLNRLLSEAHGERIAVIVNEYGEVGIDGQLVVETQDDVIELNNGCICCTVRSDLISAIRGLLVGERRFDRLIIETSGLADPAPVIQSFVLDDILSSHVQLDALVTVVDARHIGRQLEHEEAREQIAFADVLLVNKIDLEDDARIQDVETEVRRLNPLATMYRTCGSEIAREAVLDVGAFDLKNLLRLDLALLDDHEHAHDADIACVAIRSPGSVDAAAFERWLAQLLQAQGADLLRIKGIVDFAGEPRRYVFHGVHMTLDGRPGRPWKPTETRLNELVFIGRSLDAGALRLGFDSCRAVDMAIAE